MPLRYLARRFVYAVISLVGVSLVTFVILRIIPGDPALLMVSPYATPNEIQEMRAAIGTDKPIPEQYVIWLDGIAHGDLGKSLRFGGSVGALVLDRLPATLELVIVSVIFAFAVAVGLSVVGVMKQGTLWDQLGAGIGFLGFAIPTFLWALLFIVFAGAVAQLLPVSDRIASGMEVRRVSGFMLVDSLLAGNWDAFVSSSTHLILPAASLGLPLVAMILRTLKSSLLEVVNEDYIFTDRMKGLSELYIISVRALKNALIPAITLLGVQFSFLMSGSIIVEKIFSWPGLGSLALTAVQYRDFPLIQGLIMVYALVLIATNLVVDLLYARLNPRIQYG
ncbi:MAG: ABC transporter permease [Chloroflexi bacterium]|nr:ABC transporter permease [Chloroflexota bacterium]